MTFLVAEGYVFKGNFAFDGRHFHGILRILNQNRLVNGFKNTFQIGDGGQERVIKTCQCVNRLPETADVCGKSNQYADGQGGGRS